MDRNEEIDDSCREVCRSVLSGETSETDGRLRIFELIVSTKLHVQVSRKEQVRYSQEFEDLVDENFRLLWNKMSQDDGAGWEFSRGLEASAVGWARRLLTSPLTRASSLRNIRTQREKADLVNPLNRDVSDYSAPALAASAAAYHTTESSLVAPMHEDEERDARFNAATDWMNAKRRNIRDTSAVAAKTSALIHAFDIPRPVRPSWKERHQLLDLISVQQDMGWKSAAAMFALSGGKTPDLEPVHPALLSVWDDFEREDLERLFLSDPQVANTLMDFACMDYARPSRSDIRTFASETMARGSGTGWAPISQQLVESMIAFEFEAVSAFDTTGKKNQSERQVGHQLARYKLPGILKDAALYPDQNLGSSPCEVYSSMLAISEPMFHIETSLEESWSR